MVKNHLKRIATPRTWNILRKAEVFITKPNAGAHPRMFSTSLNTLLKEYVNIANTRKEVKKILHDKACLVDGKIIHDERFNVGFLDIISFPSTKKYYRVILDNKGKLSTIEIKDTEKDLKIIKIIGKQNVVKGKTQIAGSDGRVFILDKDAYKVGDSLLIEVPSQTIKTHLPLATGVVAMAMKGKHAGEHGIIENIEGNMISIKTKESTFITRKGNVFVTGQNKNTITCSQ